MSLCHAESRIAKRLNRSVAGVVLCAGGDVLAGSRMSVAACATVCEAVDARVWGAVVANRSVLAGAPFAAECYTQGLQVCR